MSHAIPRPQASLQFGKPSRKMGRAADACVKWSKKMVFFGGAAGRPGGRIMFFGGTRNLLKPIPLKINPETQ